MAQDTYRINNILVTESDFFVTCRFHNSFLVINQLNSQVHITLDEQGVIPELQRVLGLFSRLIAAIRKHQLKQEFSEDIVEFGDLLTDVMISEIN